MKLILRFLIPLFLFFLNFYSHSALACEPCEKTLNLDDTIKSSVLILIGTKIQNGPSIGSLGADWIEVRIIRILKGESAKSNIKINSIDGMCDYGIEMNSNQEYIVFLRKLSDTSPEYDSVASGCAVKTLPIKNNQVEIDHKKIRVKDFISKFKLKVNDPSKKEL